MLASFIAVCKDSRFCAGPECSILELRSTWGRPEYSQSGLSGLLHCREHLTLCGQRSRLALQRCVQYIWCCVARLQFVYCVYTILHAGHVPCRRLMRFFGLTQWIYNSCATPSWCVAEEGLAVGWVSRLKRNNLTRLEWCNWTTGYTIQTFCYADFSFQNC